MITVNQLKLNGKNKIFFNNSKFHGDYKYEIFRKLGVDYIKVFMEDTVETNGKYLKHERIYKIEDGKITNVID